MKYGKRPSGPHERLLQDGGSDTAIRGQGIVLDTTVYLLIPLLSFREAMPKCATFITTDDSPAQQRKKDASEKAADYPTVQIALKRHAKESLKMIK